MAAPAHCIGGSISGTPLFVLPAVTTDNAQGQGLGRVLEGGPGFRDYVLRQCNGRNSTVSYFAWEAMRFGNSTRLENWRPSAELAFNSFILVPESSSPSFVICNWG